MDAELHSAIADGILQEVHFQFITAQVLRALKYLHSASLIHRDLKPSNILLNADGRTKVCDFGLVRSLAEEAAHGALTEDVATRWYRAPEVLLGSRSYGPAADMWSLGCILGEMVRGRPMFPGESTIQQLEHIVSFTGMPSGHDLQALESDNAAALLSSLPCTKARALKDWFPSGSEQAKHLVVALLQFNPHKRLTALQALRHPFVQAFVAPKQEPLAPGPICPDISDNVKLTVKQYRTLIQGWVQQVYPGSLPPRKEAKENLPSNKPLPTRTKSESLKALKNNSFTQPGKPEQITQKPLLRSSTCLFKRRRDRDSRDGDKDVSCKDVSCKDARDTAKKDVLCKEATKDLHYKDHRPKDTKDLHYKEHSFKEHSFKEHRELLRRRP
jgi:serine/threonine protein kinase